MANLDENNNEALVSLASALLLELKKLTANYFIDYQGEVLCREVLVTGNGVYLEAEEIPIKYLVLHNPSYQETTDSSNGDKISKTDAGNITAMQGNQVFWGFYGNNTNELYTGESTDKIIIHKPEILSLIVNNGKEVTLKYELYY